MVFGHVAKEEEEKDDEILGGDETERITERRQSKCRREKTEVWKKNK
jgi:hypothetical protein